MTAFDVKFVPTTFIVTALDPAAIVCGRTAVMLGTPSGSTTVLPQPRNEMQVVIPTLTAIAFNTLKTHL